jgi:Acyl carrier protein
MTLQEKIDFLEEIMDVEEGTLEADTSLDDIEEWDSLSALSLTVELKKKYELELTSKILQDFKTINDICCFIPD